MGFLQKLTIVVEVKVHAEVPQFQGIVLFRIL